MQKHEISTRNTFITSYSLHSVDIHHHKSSYVCKLHVSINSAWSQMRQVLLVKLSMAMGLREIPQYNL